MSELIDREKILEKCKGKCDGNVNCEKCKRKDAGTRCVFDNIVDETLEQIDPILKAKDEEIADLRDALLVFATVGEAIANHRNNRLAIKDGYLLKAYNVFERYKESKR